MQQDILIFKETRMPMWKPLFMGAPKTLPPQDAPKHEPLPLVRVRRVRVLGANYPTLVLEATPNGALDVMDLCCVKAVEPNPTEAEPDQCGSNIYTAVICTLYEWDAVLEAIENLNAPDPVRALLEEPAMYREKDLLWLNPLDRAAAETLGLDVITHTAKVEGDMTAVALSARKTVTLGMSGLMRICGAWMPPGVGRMLDMSQNNPFLNERRRAVLTAIAEGITRDGYAPSTRALVVQVGMSSTSVVAYHIHALEQAGYLIRPRDANGKAFAHTMSLTAQSRTVCPNVTSRHGSAAHSQAGRSGLNMPNLYPLHPFADLFPEMSGSEYGELREDIRRHGMRESITLANSEFILDGRHRSRVCAELGIEPRYRDFVGTDEQLLAFVISSNLRRRHLSREQREIIAAQITSLKPGRPELNSSPELVISQSTAARQMDVSLSGLKRAKTIVDKGAPELIQAVKDGKIETSVAADLALAPQAEQKEIIARGEKEIHAASKKLRAESKAARKEKRRNELSVKAADFELEPVLAADAIKIVCADARDLLQYVEPETADLVITSPPYNVRMPYDHYTDDLPEAEYRDLLAFPVRALLCRPQGRRAHCCRSCRSGWDAIPTNPLRRLCMTFSTSAVSISRGWIVWDKNNVQNSTAWGSHRIVHKPGAARPCRDHHGLSQGQRHPGSAGRHTRQR
jgi:hypothetical protein